MSMNKQMDELIQLLTLGTRSSSFQWEPTANENAFRLKSNAANVRLIRSEEFDPQVEQTFLVRTLEVLNDKGRVIEEYSPSDPTGITHFEELFSDARRSAYKTDETLQNLFGELRSKIQAQSI